LRSANALPRRNSNSAWRGSSCAEARSTRAFAAATFPLASAVAPNAVARLALVTLAPSQVGDFTLTARLQTRSASLPVGAPLSFHLGGFLFRGKGNGHGLGMSQWGARGRAQAGQNYRTILSAYYQGTRIEQRDTSGLVRLLRDSKLQEAWYDAVDAGPLGKGGRRYQVGAPAYGAPYGSTSDEHGIPADAAKLRAALGAAA